MLVLLTWQFSCTSTMNLNLKFSFLCFYLWDGKDLCISISTKSYSLTDKHEPKLTQYTQIMDSHRSRYNSKKKKSISLTKVSHSIALLNVGNYYLHKSINSLKENDYRYHVMCHKETNKLHKNVNEFNLRSEKDCGMQKKKYIG